MVIYQRKGGEKIVYLHAHLYITDLILKEKNFFFFLNPGFGGFVSELPPLVSIAPPEVMKLF